MASIRRNKRTKNKIMKMALVTIIQEETVFITSDTIVESI